MAHLLFAVRKNQVIVRDPEAGPSEPWRQIGTTDVELKSLMSLGGVLFGFSPSNSKLYARLATLDKLQWSEIDNTYNVVTHAAANGILFGITADQQVWWREPVFTTGTLWKQLGTVAKPLALTFGMGQLILATSDNKLLRRNPTASVANWETMPGTSGNAEALAAVGNTLYAVTRNNEIKTGKIDFERGVDWTILRGSIRVQAMTAAELVPTSVRLADLPAIEDDVQLRTGTDG